MEFETRKEVYDYLNSYKNLKLDREDYENRMGGLKAISYSMEAPGTPMTSTSKLNYYMEKIQEIEKSMDEIEMFIDDNFTGDDKRAIILVYIEGLTYNDAADRIYLSYKGIGSRIRRSIDNYIKGNRRKQKV